jgi:hypothetical protein
MKGDGYWKETDIGKRRILERDGYEKYLKPSDWRRDR